MKDAKESGVNGSQKPLILECDWSFEKSFQSQPPICQVFGGSECLHPGVFQDGVDSRVKNSCRSGSDVTPRLPNSPYQHHSLLLGNKKVPGIMTHATWKKTVSYVRKDLSNTRSAIIHLATPGSLETIINNTYLNCFHSLCPGASNLPHIPTPFFPRQMSHEGPSASYGTTPQDGPFKHTRAHCSARLLLKLSTTAFNLSSHHLLRLGVSIFLRPHSCFGIHPLFFSQLDGRGCEGQFCC